MGFLTFNDSPTNSNDGRIVNVIATDLANANTSYTYFDLAGAGYKYATLMYVITATTLTIEACDVGLQPPSNPINSVATSTDGTGATLTASTLNTTNGFTANTDLIGIQVQITADATTPANVGLIRTVTAYTGASGAMTLSAVIGAITSGVTQFQLQDNVAPWTRRVTDPTVAQWLDVTTALTGAATITATGGGIIDMPTVFERFRIKRVTTNATNALSLRLNRGR